ncbi:MAG TPA: response regulator transcription factor [Terriglobales bacterium]|nr:response regulator transcription factor [Terriglobales bacterium]
MESISLRMLVIEDDAKIGSFIVRGLKEAGFAVDHADNGEEGLNLALSASYDAAVIDLMLPGRDGLSVIEELRRKKIRTPVIILSAKRSVDDRVKGLQSGSDDYLIKPFSFAELLARIQALLRRATQGGELSPLVVGDLSLDLLTRDCMRCGRKIELQPREFALLEYLMRNVGRVLTKTLILEHVWGYHFYPQTNVVDVLVSRLRNKVDREFEIKLIHTIRGVGYALKESGSCP